MSGTEIAIRLPGQCPVLQQAGQLDVSINFPMRDLNHVAWKSERRLSNFSRLPCGPVESPVLDVTIDNQFDFQSGEYEDLFRRSNATAFQHPDWLSALYRQLVPQLKIEPLVVTIRAAPQGRLLMVLPLIRRRY